MAQGWWGLAMGFAALNPSYVGMDAQTIVEIVGWVERSETHHASIPIILKQL